MNYNHFVFSLDLISALFSPFPIYKIGSHRPHPFQSLLNTRRSKKILISNVWYSEFSKKWLFKRVKNESVPLFDLKWPRLQITQREWTWKEWNWEIPDTIYSKLKAIKFLMIWKKDIYMFTYYMKSSLDFTISCFYHKMFKVIQTSTIMFTEGAYKSNWNLSRHFKSYSWLDNWSNKILRVAYL